MTEETVGDQRVTVKIRSREVRRGATEEKFDKLHEIVHGIRLTDGSRRGPEGTRGEENRGKITVKFRRGHGEDTVKLR